MRVAATEEGASAQVTFVLWFQLGEFLRCSVGPISESGPEALVGDAVGVLVMRSGDTLRPED